MVGTGTPVPGATVAPDWSLAAVTADADGNYIVGDVANPPFSPYMLSVSAPGMITHDAWITWARGARTGVNIDLIRDAPPFSMDFYREMVRGTYDDARAPWPNRRWMTAPSFYIRTVASDGRPLEPEVVAVTIDALRRAVPGFTGGRYTAAAIQTGTEVREAAADWINVDFKRERGADVPCGTSYIGNNPGTITLYLDVCDCGSIKVPGEVTMHEVGHAMGFFHVSDRKSLMYPQASYGCPAGSLSAAEAYHASVAYSRPRGNTDPDHDPSSGAALAAAAMSGPLVR